MSRTEFLARPLGKSVQFFIFAIPCTVAWTVAGAHIALGSALLLGFLYAIVHRRWPVSRTPMDLGWIAYSLSLVLAAVFATPEARSYGPLEKLALIPIIHLMAANLRTPRQVQIGYRLFVLGISITALIATIFFLSTDAPSPHARLRGTMHYMTFAGLLLLALPHAISAFWSEKRGWRLCFIVCSVVLSLALVLTSTRSAWLGAILAVCVLIVRVRPILTWVPLVLSILIYFVMPANFQDRARSIFDPSHPNNIDRIYMWQAGWAMWQDHPWTGVGIGDLKPLVSQYADPQIQRVHGHLHNVWVQVLATTGVIGLAAYSYLMFLVARTIFRSGCRSNTRLRPWALGSWSAFAGFTLMGLFEWNFGDVEITIALYFLLGLVAAAARLDNAEEGLSGTSPRSTLFKQGEH